ncbi:multicomponent Na+:H+ antiporter subunit D [Desulfonauticus submarinus]|uniref:Multicomponent Na+:H+ antiporter subunit D n=1 Tax=Desulfonauticus submarinus TaxID=206665 RepID=A0A1H0GF48_9BACT|nr:Na(+)/H(+) antiporter subunit D [Desulfonauticus submarinus]SDO05520.1 multicomponent Na+:H+ antiporter subunit D [Desulfonauticus submarinus]
MNATNFIHPAFIFIIFAGILTIWKHRSFKYLLPLPGIIAIFCVLLMKPGIYNEISYLGFKLTLGRVDTLSIVFAHVFAIQSIIGFIYAFHVKERAQHIAAALYVAGAFGSTFAGDYFTLFIFWELMAVASTFLVWLNQNNPKATNAGFRYFIFHTLGGLFLLGGLLLRYKVVGNFDFVPISPSSATIYDYLILIGFAVNAAVVPLHAWLPDAYPEATITGAVFMSAFTTKTAVYVLARGFAGFEILAIAGTIMAIYGVFYATIENNARRILAYHIVSQVGYMVAGIGIGTSMTLNGACAHAYAHILYKGLLFMGAGSLLYATGTAKLSELGGLATKLPWVFVFYMVGAVSISGFPLFSGFVSKTMVISGAAEAHRTILALGLELAAVGTFLSVGIKLPYFAFYGEKKYSGSIKPLPKNMYVAMFIASFLCFFIGVYPNFLYHLLPFEVEYTPYTPWHLEQTLLLLSFTGLGFYVLRKKLTPEPKLNLDFDYFYRLIGRSFLKLCKNPIEKIDNWWSEIYKKIGLRGLMGLARGSALFDWEEIDRVIDGFAYNFIRCGNNISKIQKGDVRIYLGISVLIAFAIFSLIYLF